MLFMRSFIFFDEKVKQKLDLRYRLSYLIYKNSDKT